MPHVLMARPSLTIAYLAIAVLVAMGVTWALTVVAADDGPVRPRVRVSYAVLGMTVGLCWLPGIPVALALVAVSVATAD